MKHIPLSECEICSQIQGGEYANIIGGDSLSPAAEKLVGSTQSYGMFENISTCPICGTDYKNTNDCGFMENDVTLWRISPTEAGEKLTEEDVDFFQSCLKTEDENTRDYAATSLLDHYLSLGGIKELQGFLTHENREIRLSAVVRLRGKDEHGEYANTLLELLKGETDEQVRLNIICYFGYNNLDRTLEHLSEVVSTLKDSAQVIRIHSADVLGYFVRTHGKKALLKEVAKQKIDLNSPDLAVLRKWVEKE